MTSATALLQPMSIVQRVNLLMTRQPSEIVTNDQIFKAYQYQPLIIAYRNDQARYDYLM